MYKLFVKKDDKEEILEFATAELAQLYRDYHLAFGHWNGLTKWVEEKHLTEEEKAFIVDEKTELVAGGIIRFYKLTTGVEFCIEKAEPTQIDQAWYLFRKKRDRALLDTDWTQLADSPVSAEVRKDYRSYRNYLRVLPSLHNDSSILNAKVYSFQDWKKGLR